MSEPEEVSIQHVDTILDLDGDPIEVSVHKDIVILSLPTPYTFDIHLDAERLDQFAKALAEAGRRAEAHAQAARQEGCPIMAVFEDGPYPCTLGRGHDGGHEFATLPAGWEEMTR